MKKEKAHRIRRGKTQIVIVLLCVVIASFGLIILNDGFQRNRVNKSIDGLKAGLNNNGFSGIERKRGCGRTQVKIGNGALVCTVGLDYLEDYSLESGPNAQQQLLEKVNARVSQYYQLLDSNEDFSRDSTNLPEVNLPNKGFTHGTRLYKHNATGRYCGGSIDFSWEKLELHYFFTCDDTSWFDKTFNDGSFSL